GSFTSVFGALSARETPAISSANTMDFITSIVAQCGLASGLLFAQGLHRLQSRGATGGAIACGQGHDREQGDRRSQRGRIIRLKPEQKSAGGLSRPKRQAGSQRKARQ